MTKKKQRPFWKQGLNPITMWKPQRVINPKIFYNEDCFAQMPDYKIHTVGKIISN